MSGIPQTGYRTQQQQQFGSAMPIVFASGAAKNANALLGGAADMQLAYQQQQQQQQQQQVLAQAQGQQQQAAAFAYAPPLVQQQPPPSAGTPLAQQQIDASGKNAGGGGAPVSKHVIPVTVVFDATTGKIAPVKPLVKPLEKLGYDTSKQIHIIEAKVLDTHSSLPAPIKASFNGLNGDPAHVGASTNGNADLDGKKHSTLVHPGVNYVPEGRGTVYSQPLPGNYDDTSEHAKIDVDQMRKSITVVPGSNYAHIYADTAPDLTRLIQGSPHLAGPTLAQTSTADGVRYFTLTQSDAHKLIDNYEQQVAKQFVKTTPDKHTVTFAHFDSAENHFGAGIAKMPGQTRSLREVNSSAETKHGITLNVEYTFVHPDGPVNSAKST